MKGQLKDTLTMEQKKDNHYNRNEHNRQNAQGQNNTHKANGFAYMMRKAEKLTTALYLVSDIMSDKEPMKWIMRETGVEILSDVTVSSTGATSARITDLRHVMKKIEKIISFLDIAQSTRMISEMNASVLKKEYIGLRHDVEAEWNRTYEQSRIMLTESFFHVPHAEELSLGTAVSEAPSNTVERPPVNLQHKMHSVSPLRVVDTVTPLRAPIESSTREAHTNTTPLAPVVPMTGGKREEIKMASEEPRVHVERLVSEKPGRPDFLDGTSILENQSTPVVRVINTLRDTAVHARTDVVRDDRRKIILALIKQKPQLTVKDIAKSIPGVSEKTIQRELLAMVAERVLEKNGERRWSSYSMKGQ